jgi:hypothetical protein
MSFFASFAQPSLGLPLRPPDGVVRSQILVEARERAERIGEDVEKILEMPPTLTVPVSSGGHGSRGVEPPFPRRFEKMFDDQMAVARNTAGREGGERAKPFGWKNFTNPRIRRPRM